MILYTVQFNAAKVYNYLYTVPGSIQHSIIAKNLKDSILNEEALGLSERVAVGMIVLEGIASVVSVLCIYVYKEA